MKRCAAWLTTLAVVSGMAPASADAPTRIALDRVDCRLFVRHAPTNVSRPYEAKRDATLVQDDAFRCASPGKVSYHVLGRAKIVSVSPSEWYTVPHLPTAGDIGALKHLKDQLEVERGGRIASGKQQTPDEKQKLTGDR